WHMVTHFFNDITHFDGKFFVTLKDLLFRPGFLSKEYMKGRRASYLHPVRMYVFTSAIFFLLFFSIFSVHNNVNVDSPDKMSGRERLKELERIESAIRKDSSRLKNDSSYHYRLRKLEEMKDTTRPVTWDDFTTLGADLFVFNISGRSDKYASIA